MKENVFDVLIYLFQNYMDGDEEHAPDPDALRDELLEAGFPGKEVTRAFEWLESLAEQPPIGSLSSPSFRVFSHQEKSRLDTECRGFLMFLEQSGILTSTSHELVIDRLMALHEDPITLENLKWVVLMILFSQPSEEAAYARMENLVYDAVPEYLH
jgi:Smg protein